MGPRLPSGWGPASRHDGPLRKPVSSPIRPACASSYIFSTVASAGGFSRCSFWGLFLPKGSTPLCGQGFWVEDEVSLAGVVGSSRPWERVPTRASRILPGHVLGALASALWPPPRGRSLREEWGPCPLFTALSPQPGSTC